MAWPAEPAPARVGQVGGSEQGCQPGGGGSFLGAESADLLATAGAERAGVTSVVRALQVGGSRHLLRSLWLVRRWPGVAGECPAAPKLLLPAPIAFLLAWSSLTACLTRGHVPLAWGLTWRRARAPNCLPAFGLPSASAFGLSTCWETTLRLSAPCHPARASGGPSP